MPSQVPVVNVYVQRWALWALYGCAFLRRLGLRPVMLELWISRRGVRFVEAR